MTRYALEQAWPKNKTLWFSYAVKLQKVLSHVFLFEVRIRKKPDSIYVWSKIDKVIIDSRGPEFEMDETAQTDEKFSPTLELAQRKLIKQILE